jgi:hypothetical protein
MAEREPREGDHPQAEVVYESEQAPKHAEDEQADNESKEEE